MKEPYEIIIVPNEILHEVAQPVTSFDDSLRNIIIKMVRVLRSDKNGIGLSANQLGLKQRVCVVEFIDSENKEKTIPLQIFINPKIAETSPEFETLEEGCLSVPKIELPVERSTKIKVKAQNQQGKKIRLTAKGLLARVLQHEIDHLNGILFTDRVKEKLYQQFPQLKKLKIVFIGSGDFAELILEGLILLDLNIKQIITEKGKPAGRTQEIKPTPVVQMAEKFGKKYLEIDDLVKANHIPSKVTRAGRAARLKGEAERVGCDLLAGQIDSRYLLTGIGEPDLLICADFGKILPQNILKLPKIAAINIHPSLLPKYRGPSPIQTAILKGEKETGVSIIKMTSEIDKGPILVQDKVEIFDYDNSNSLKSRLANLALKMLLMNLPKFQSDKFQKTPQDETQASYTKKFQKIDGEIDWQKSPAEIDRQIRALYPWPGSFTFIDNKRLIIHAAHIEEKKLVLDVIQPEGGKPMKFTDFLRGFRGQKPKWFKKIVV